MQTMTKNEITFEQLSTLVAEYGYTLEVGPENVAHPSRSVWIARHHTGENNIYGDAETIRYCILRKTIKTQEAEKENINMAKTDPYIRKPVHPPTEHLVDGGDDPSVTGRPSLSQSPQARRGSAQDYSKFGDRTVNDGITWKEDPSVGDAFDNASPLRIEDKNPKK
jgi:hypothetical protein